MAYILPPYFPSLENFSASCHSFLAVLTLEISGKHREQQKLVFSYVGLLVFMYISVFVCFCVCVCVRVCVCRTDAAASHVLWDSLMFISSVLVLQKYHLTVFLGYFAKVVHLNQCVFPHLNTHTHTQHATLSTQQ